MAKEIKKITLHPLKKDGTIDTDIDLLPRTSINSIVDEEGNLIEVATKDELEIIGKVNESGWVPNIVTDIYKLRGGENTQIRIWSMMDLGTLRKSDLFVTNSRLDIVDIGYEKIEYELVEEDYNRLMDFQSFYNLY